MNIEEIKKEILKEIDNGFLIDASLFEFANNLGFEISFEDLEDILKNRDHEIYEELSSLIFSPDIGLRKRFAFIWMEINLNGLNFNPESLLKDISSVNLEYKGKRLEISGLDEFVLIFINKLGLLKRADKNLLKSVLVHEDEVQKEITALIWSNSDKINDKKSELLNSYLLKTDLPGLFSMEEFSFFLNILSSWNKKKESFEKYISKLVHIYQKAYRESVETDAFLKNNNVETFMVQGGKVLFSNPSKLSLQKHHLWGIANRLGLSKEIFTIDGFDMVYDKNRLY